MFDAYHMKNMYDIYICIPNNASPLPSWWYNIAAGNNFSFWSKGDLGWDYNPQFQEWKVLPRIPMMYLSIMCRGKIIVCGLDNVMVAKIPHKGQRDL